jgi:hypothetical protein
LELLILYFYKKKNAMANSKSKKNGPIPIPPEIIAAHKESVIKGIKKAAKIVGPMAAATVAAFRRKPEERMDLKGGRQLARASRKEARSNRLSNRAENMAETNPMKAAKLDKRSQNLSRKASTLRDKGNTNQAAAKVVYDSKLNAKQNKK